MKSTTMAIQSARKMEKERNGNGNSLMLMRMGYMLPLSDSVRKLGCWVWFERGVKAWEGKLMRLSKVLLCSSTIRGSGARKCISACLFYLKLVTHHYRIISHPMFT
jgi:hypothetical protein